MALMRKFAVNLKRARRQSQLSQEGLASKSGYCTSYVSMLERGQRSPPLETIEKLAHALGVAPMSLLS
jgi:transcriptional regulator with XRE-family HTH domain